MRVEKVRSDLDHLETEDTPDSQESVSEESHFVSSSPDREQNG